MRATTECRSEGVDSSQKTAIQIIEPGYYRIGKGVRHITRPDTRFTIVDSSGTYGFSSGSVYAHPGDQVQWISVTEEMLKGGALQFEISHLKDAEPSQLLSRDEAREAEIA